MGIWRNFISGIYNLLLGLKVTASRLPQPAVTLQYPEEKWEEMPERSRGIVVLLSDTETGRLNCTACLLCQKACPTGAITIDRDRGEDKKWYLKSFTVDNTICCFCGLCEEACNFAAIKMAAKYEFSVFDQSELVFDMNKLQEIGRDVPYTPIPKKKPAAKKPEAPKPAPEGNGEADRPAGREVRPATEAKNGDLFEGMAGEPESKAEPSADNSSEEKDCSGGKQPEAKG